MTEKELLDFIKLELEIRRTELRYFVGPCEDYSFEYYKEKLNTLDKCIKYVQDLKDSL